MAKDLEVSRRSEAGSLDKPGKAMSRKERAEKLESTQPATLPSGHYAEPSPFWHYHVRSDKKPGFDPSNVL